MEAALAGIPAGLKRLISAAPAEEEDLLKAYAAAGIKITKRTANQFTPLVKLVFPKKVHKAATVSRYASVLQFAEEENVRPSGSADFVRQKGGLAACAARASEKRRNAAGGSRQAGTAAAEALEARRRNAPTLQLPPGIPHPKEGPILLLVEPGPKKDLVDPWLPPCFGGRCGVILAGQCTTTRGDGRQTAGMKLHGPPWATEGTPAVRGERYGPAVRYGRQLAVRQDPSTAARDNFAPRRFGRSRAPPTECSVQPRRPYRNRGQPLRFMSRLLP